MATAAGSDSEEEGHSDDDDHKTLCDISRFEDLTVDEGIDDLIQGLWPIAHYLLLHLKNNH